VVRRHPLACYFGAAYLVSLAALAIVGLPKLHRGGGRPTTALVMFPVMVIAVGLTGVGLTAVTGGRAGLTQLRSRVAWPAHRRWLLLLALPPMAILVVLGVLDALVSPRFAPKLFVFGIAAGLLAGFSEELGWTGFAYPRLRARFGALPGALLLGALWGMWHFPVVDSLGAASPHGRYIPAFFAAFMTLVVALRVLIAWLYNRTGSLLMAQLLHASSTGFLVVFSAPAVTPAQEALWYFLYAAVLWAVVIAVIASGGSALGAASSGGRHARRPLVGSAAVGR
jgi:membrane protease YdiL (CAAX protease family)